MEQWRQELQIAIDKELKDSNEEFNEVFMEMLIDDIWKDLDSTTPKRRRGGSWVIKKFVQRDWEAWHEHLVQDYFAPSSIYNHVKFKHQFRMRRELFLRIVHSIVAFDLYFVWKHDALGSLGLSSTKVHYSAPDACISCILPIGWDSRAHRQRWWSTLSMLFAIVLDPNTWGTYI